MAIITVPASVEFRNVRWTYKKPQQVNRSEWTNHRTVVDLPGAPAWSFTAELVPVIGEVNSLGMQAFLAQLDGTKNQFRMIAVEGDQHAGSEPTQTSGAANSRAVGLSGMPASATFLAAGRKITVKLASGAEQLVRLTAPIVADGSGNGTATIESPLRSAAATAVTCGTKRPWALVALDDPDTAHGVDPGQLYSFALTATEDF